jgi:uncharacterized membrane protein YdjX (TVP38/TMEM64 family)
MRRPLVAVLIVVVAVLVGAGLFSYWTSGVVGALVTSAEHQDTWLEQLRTAVRSWGRLAPVVYTLAVVVEVVVAPIPGALLYAPGGAIFGAFWGGTLALVGNVIGAALCCVLGRLIGERLVGAQARSPQFARYRAQLADRGLWVVLLLRANPLTSSDLVSYAAGVAGVPAWKVAAGTLVGLGPLCYLQAYFAEQVFTLIPGWLLVAGGVVLLAIVFLIVSRSRNGEDGGDGGDGGAGGDGDNGRSHGDTKVTETKRSN